MNTTYKVIKISALLVLVTMIISACGAAAPAEPTQDPNAIFTQVAEAVEAARSGDTIEIRRNGRYTTAPLTLGDKALILRAAAGFEPILEAAAQAGARRGDVQAAGPALLSHHEVFQDRVAGHQNGCWRRLCPWFARWSLRL